MDVEKTMQFIVEIQAKHDATLQQILETQARHDERFLRFQEQTEERFRTLVDVSMSLTHNLQALSEETDRRFRETDERFRETDYKLNALIDVVEKLVKRNGSK
ncbi:MAG: hypothetical protein ACRD2B_06620 [Terriglobia bacterium]